MKLSKMFLSSLSAIPVVILSFNTALDPGRLNGDDGWGDFTGRIIVDGTVPKPADLVLDKDADYCRARGETFTDRSILVGENGGLQHVYVMMLLKRGADPPKVHPSYDEGLTKKIVLNNKKCRFEPQAVFLRVGQPIELKNDDAIGHNCHITTFANEENINLGAGATVDLTLDTPDRIPGVVKCDIHTWMEALIIVRQEPYVAITDSDGKFSIKNIPEGNWTFQFWHKRVGYMRELKKDGETFLGRRGEFEVTIKPNEALDLGELRFQSTDFKKR